METRAGTSHSPIGVKEREQHLLGEKPPLEVGPIFRRLLAQQMLLVCTDPSCFT